MYTFIRRRYYVILLISFFFINSGCVPLLIGAAAGAGTVTYVKGELNKVYSEPIYVMHSAALGALRSMDLIITDDDLEKHYALIIGAFDDGKKFRIDIKAITEESSEVKVRVGFFGDQIRSESILNAIQRKL